MAYHYQDNWFWERLSSGSVQIHHHLTPDFVDVQLEIDADSWCSIVAAMSAEGDTAKAFKTASELHQGQVY